MSTFSDASTPPAASASIIIRTLNEGRWLPDLLNGISEQSTSAVVETILVDSGSDDSTVEIARAAGCRILTIDRSDFTFGRSLNMGCADATGNILIFISGHCIPQSQDWLDQLITPITEGAATYVYGRQIGGEVSRYSEHRIFEKYYPKDSDLAQGGYFCNNANSAISREVWEDFHFDEALTGLEDMELAKRLYEAGHTIQYVPEAIVAHLHEETWRQVRTRYEREAVALQKIAPEIRVGFFDFLRYTLSAIWHDLTTAAGERALVGKAKSIVQFRAMQYFGTYRGNQVQRTLSRRAMERYFYPRVDGDK